MVEVVTNGVSLDLVSPRVKYVKQVNDFFDVSTIKCSYTPYLKADKTQKNTSLFEGLGLVGDTSDFPYLKNSTQLIDNGVVLISKGNLVVKETDEEYKIYIQDGVIDVFKIMENKNVGDNLDLQELEHNKTPQNIVDSWQFASPYRYLISDYNGRTNDGYEIDQEYQIPSVNWKFLWDKLFNFLNYTYSGDFSFIQDKWITYPKPPEIENEDIVNRVKVTSESYDGDYDLASYKNWNPFIVLDSVTTIAPQNWKFKINLTGNYRIKTIGFGDMRYESRAGLFSLDIIAPYKLVLTLNGSPIYSDLSFPFNQNSNFNTFSFQSGDILELLIFPMSVTDWQSTSIYNDLAGIYKIYIDGGNYEVTNLDLDYIAFEMDSTGIENIDFGVAFSELSLKDFFKETIIRGGLTPFTDNVKRHIDFVPMSERLDVNQNNIVNWSEKFVKRNSEKYIYGTYAQRNEYKLKYNNEEDNYNDGALLVPNQNLADVKTLFTSKFYAPDQGLESIFYSANDSTLMPKVRMWDKEIKVDENGDQIIEYKPLSGRFYALKAELVNDSIDIGDASSNLFYKASISGTRFNDILESKYKVLDRIFNKTKIHEIELALSSLDIAQLDFKKLYYFEDENQFYVLNRVSYESGKTCKGEFIRVRNI